MTLIIENVQDEFLIVLKSLAKISKNKVKINKLTSEIEAEIIKERNEILKQYKKGTLKTFKNMKEYRKAMNV